MNTLSRTVTARFFPNPDSYNALHKHWSVLINSERKDALSAAHHLLYLALSGKDWRKAFTPPTNQRKLVNGAFVGWALFRALQTLNNQYREHDLLAPFDDLVTSQMLKELQSLLPVNGNPYAFHVDQFAKGAFPFEAYKKDETYAITKPIGKSHE